MTTETIRLEQYLAHPQAKVWSALTDPELHARWWAALDVRAEVGHRFELDMGEWGRQRCTVLAVEPEGLFSYTFAEGALDTTITWRVTAEGDGTRLLLEHAGFDLGNPMGKQAFDGMGAGWPHVVPRIDRALAAA